MIDAIHDGSLNSAEMAVDPIFGLHYPKACASVPSEMLNPRNAWADKAEYDKQAHHLARLFKDNFAKFANVPDAIRKAGPLV